MKNRLWAKSIKASADPERAKHFIELLAATSAGPKLQKFSGEQMQVLAALFSGSQALGSLLVSNPDSLGVLELGNLSHARRLQGVGRELDDLLKGMAESRDFAGALAEIRRFKQREMLRIAARDLGRISNVVEI